MHGLTNLIGWEKAMGPDGALEAFTEARDNGLVRFLGVTGHGNKAPSMHKRSLERFDFDSVILPYNYVMMQDPRYANEFNELIKICEEHQVAVQTIKSIARRSWKGRPKTHNTYFYEPLIHHTAIDKTVHWAMGLDNSFLISAGDLELLPRVLDAAIRFENRPSETEMREMATIFKIESIF
jgi:predicted aldo/keto reductase-like oxidoreductase